MFAASLRAALVTHLLNGTTAPKYTSIWLALSSADPGEAGAGLNEPSGNGYARVETATADWTQTADAADNDNAIEFPESTGAWLAGADLTWFAAYDAEAGNFIGRGQLTVARAVDAAGIVLRFKAGDLSLSIGLPA